MAHRTKRRNGNFGTMNRSKLCPSGFTKHGFRNHFYQLRALVLSVCSFSPGREAYETLIRNDGNIETVVG